MKLITIEKSKQDISRNLLPHLETRRCCCNSSSYEITYGHISRKWLVCNQCLELDFFKIGIKEKVRIQV